MAECRVASHSNWGTRPLRLRLIFWSCRENSRRREPSDRSIIILRTFSTRIVDLWVLLSDGGGGGGGGGGGCSGKW